MVYAGSISALIFVQIWDCASGASPGLLTEDSFLRAQEYRVHASDLERQLRSGNASRASNELVIFVMFSIFILVSMYCLLMPDEEETDVMPKSKLVETAVVSDPPDVSDMPVNVQVPQSFSLRGDWEVPNENAVFAFDSRGKFFVNGQHCGEAFDIFKYERSATQEEFTRGDGWKTVVCEASPNAVTWRKPGEGTITWYRSLQPDSTTLRNQQLVASTLAEGISGKLTQSDTALARDELDEDRTMWQQDDANVRDNVVGGSTGWFDPDLAIAREQGDDKRILARQQLTLAVRSRDGQQLSDAIAFGKSVGLPEAELAIARKICEAHLEAKLPSSAQSLAPFRTAPTEFKPTSSAPALSLPLSSTRTLLAAAKPTASAPPFRTISGEAQPRYGAVPATSPSLQSGDARDTRSQLAEAVKSRDVRQLQEAIAVAVQSNLSGVELAHARKVLQDLQGVGLGSLKDPARQKLLSACKSRNVAELEEAIATGESAGLPGAELAYARQILLKSANVPERVPDVEPSITEEGTMADRLAVNQTANQTWAKQKLDAAVRSRDLRKLDEAIALGDSVKLPYLDLADALKIREEERATSRSDEAAQDRRGKEEESW